MAAKPFRFAVQAVPRSAEQWLGTARRAEELGFAALFMPDGMQLPSPLPALALAAGATTRLQVGTFVLASPLRVPGLAAWDAHSLSLLSGGRFVFGIGTGRPEVAEQAVARLGQPAARPAERLTQVERTIDELRALDGERHTPVLMAASGPRARALAAAKADIVTFAVGSVSREHFAALAAGIREAAGDRADAIEFAMPIFVVGDTMPPWAQQVVEADMATLIATDSLVILRGGPRQMADELLRRREGLGVSYVSVNAAFMDDFAPVVELLAGS